MHNDREFVRQSLDVQARARDFRMMDLPGYMEWSERKLAEGESSALIAHFDATQVWLLPRDVAQFTAEDYETLLQDLKDELGLGSV
jgi:hypothetical protein